LNAFESNLEGGNELLHQFGRAVHDLALEFPVVDRASGEAELAGLLKKTKAARQEIRRVLEQGRDRLLELNSFAPPGAKNHQPDPGTRRATGLGKLSARCDGSFWRAHRGTGAAYLAIESARITTDSFPSMPAEGMIATCDRRRALSRKMWDS